MLSFNCSSFKFVDAAVARATEVASARSANNPNAAAK